MTTLLLLQTPALFAQTHDARNLAFEHLTIDDGLSQNLVYCIRQDRQGFLWFGTNDGLNRYDGYRFTVFRHDPFDSTSIADNKVKAIYEDRAGNLWLGAGGLNRFEAATESFQRYCYDPDNPNSLSHNDVVAIGEDRAGALWIGTSGGGLCRLQIENSQNKTTNGDAGGHGQQSNDPFIHQSAIITRYVHDPNNPQSLSSDTVSAILIDRDAVLWVGTMRGVNKFAASKVEGTARHSESAPGAGFARYSQIAPDDIYLKDLGYGITSLYEDRQGTLWVGTLAGLYRLAREDRTGGLFKHYPHQPGTFLPNWKGRITAIIEDSTGKLWLATPGALAIFDPATEKYRYIRHDPSDPNSLSQDGILSIHEDRGGVIWLGTAGRGIDKYNARAKAFQLYRGALEKPPYQAGPSIRCILEDHTGKLWVAAEQEVYQLERATSEFKRFVLDSSHVAEVEAMVEDRRHRIWIAEGRRLYQYDPASERVVVYRHDPERLSKSLQEKSGQSLPQNNLQRLYEARDGSLWVMAVDAAYRWHPGTNRFNRFPLPQVDVAWIYDVYQDTAGIFWLGSDKGLLAFNVENLAFQLYQNDPQNPRSLSHNAVLSILADPHHPGRVLWLGTAGGGLNRFDLAGKSFDHFTEAEGLPNNVVYGVLADHNGNLWLSTNRGLANLAVSREEGAIPQVKSIRNYDVRDGLQSNEFNTGAYFKSPAPAGEMFFGGINGLTAFYPDEIRDNPYIPPVVITGFKRYNTDEAGGVAIVEKGISARQEIKLSYKDNIISFEFAALSFQNPEKNQYAYKLEGYREQWVQLGAKREATFTNLDPGEYVLHVKGSNNDGVWNEEGTSIKIIITPPWWQTWWAYTLYGVIFFGTLYVLRRYEMNRMLWKNRVTIERLEADKMRELDRLKSRFFANISHEFRTPLTLIMGQLESVKALAAEAKLKAKLDMAWRNAQQLLRMINQLLDLSRLEAGRMELRAVYGNIVPLLQRLTNSFESMAGLKRIRLRFESASAEIKIYHEPEKIEKIMHNLLSNALKFTPEGGKVSVQLSVTSDQSSVISKQSSHDQLITDHCLLITVKDTGTGIPKEHLPHVFDRFYQVDSSATRKYEGTGIGLAVTKELVELHGGEISVTSEEGFGATFVVRLPFSVTSNQFSVISEQVASGQDADSPAIQPSIDPSIHQSSVPTIQPSIDPAIQPPASDQEVILIVEDNADVRAYLREHLEERCQIVEAADGEDGLAKAQELVPDLVITDVMMPKMDGYTFCKHLKSDEKTSHIPIIMLTARAEEADKIAGLEIGVDDYLLKPFSPNELAVRVRNLIAIRRRLRERFSHIVALQPDASGAISMDEAFLRKVLAVVEKHLGDEDFGVEALGHEVGMSRTQIHRKLKALTNQTASELIRSLRLQRAAELLQHRAGTVAEIAFQVGFGDPSYFTKCFREQFGCLPTDYGKKL